MSSELRAWRKKADLTCEEVGAALDMSASKVSRMETGARGLFADDVAAMLGLYRVPAREREHLLALVREGAERNWQRLQTGGVPTDWAHLLRFEADAVAIHSFEPLLVPGLLQTPEYTRAILRALVDELGDTQIDALVAMRTARLGNLANRRAPTLHMIIDEAVLHRPVGGAEVMARQLRHLVSCATRPHVTVQVVPFAAGVSPGLLGSFYLLEFAGHPGLVYLEHRESTVFMEDEVYLRQAKLALRRLRAVALPPEDSARFIAEVADQMSPNEGTDRANAADPARAATQDSKNVSGPHILFPAESWAAFLVK